MLLKISLGLAILVGLATLYVTNVQVGTKITELNTQLSQTTSDLNTSRENEQKLTADNRTLKGQVETTTRTLADTTNKLSQATALAKEQTDRANNATKQLNEAVESRNDAQRELAQWHAFELTPDQIRNNLGRLRTLERDNVVIKTDNEALLRKKRDLETRLAKYEGGEIQEVQLPPGTKGNVVAVDPKYDFVILDIGGNQGVLERAKMLVNRDGKLVGKVQITSVEPNRSVANVLPEWKQDEIMEGDQVIF
jgi:hypothetical protein